MSALTTLTGPEEAEIAAVLASKPAYQADFNFAPAVTALVEREGHLVDNPSDPGHVTNWGISLAYAVAAGYDLNHDGTIDARDIMGASLADAIGIYFTDFWLKFQLGRLPGIIGAKLLDEIVPKGPTGGFKGLQRAIRACGIPIDDDGKLGTDTLNAIGTLTNRGMTTDLRNCMRSESAGYYRSLVAAKPPGAVFLKGWLNRAYS